MTIRIFPALALVGILVEHHEAHHVVVGVDRSQPRLRREVGLGDGDRVGGDEPVLPESERQ